MTFVSAIQSFARINLVARTTFVTLIEARGVSITNFVELDALVARFAQEVAVEHFARIATVSFVASVIAVFPTITRPRVPRQALLIGTDETGTRNLE